MLKGNTLRAGVLCSHGQISSVEYRLPQLVWWFNAVSFNHFKRLWNGNGFILYLRQNAGSWYIEHKCHLGQPCGNVTYDQWGTNSHRWVEFKSAGKNLVGLRAHHRQPPSTTKVCPVMCLAFPDKGTNNVNYRCRFSQRSYGWQIWWYDVSGLRSLR